MSFHQRGPEKDLPVPELPEKDPLPEQPELPEKDLLPEDDPLPEEGPLEKGQLGQPAPLWLPLLELPELAPSHPWGPNVGATPPPMPE